MHVPIGQRPISKESLAKLKAKLDIYTMLEQRERCQESLFEFTKAAWPTFDSAPFQDCWAISAMCDHLEAVASGHIPKLLINVPPRCSKTTVVSIIFPAWVWAKQQLARGKEETQEQYDARFLPLMGAQVKFLCASYSDRLALESSTKFRRLVQSDWYQQLFPLRFMRDQNSKGHMDNNHGGTRQSTSVGGTLLGLGGDILVCLPYSERILTSKGWLKIGDIVCKKLQVSIAGLAEDNSIVWQQIEQYQTNPGSNIVEIKWTDGTLRCTEDHPVFVEGRGYVRADSLKEGGIITTVGSSQDRGKQTELCDLQQDCLSVSMRAQDTVSWSILQSQMQGAVLQREEKPSLYRVFIQNTSACLQKMQQNIASRWVSIKAGFGVLLKKVRSKLGMGSQSNQKKRQSSQEGSIYQLLCMQSNLLKAHSWYSLLFQRLRKCSSFCQNVWQRECTLCAWAFQISLSRGIRFQTQSLDQSARWASMSNVRESLYDRQTVCSASHRLQQEQSGSNELDDSMQQLSCKDKCAQGNATNIGRAVVQSVKRIGREETTYNVCVAPCHNYFAEGILVHNCDDLNNTEKETTVETGADRLSAANFFSEFRSTRRNDPRDGHSAIINVQQRVHEQDVSGVWLESEEEVVHLMIPMRHDPARHNVTVKLPQYDDEEPWEDPRDPNGEELMWPERFGEFEVAGLEKALGPFMAAGRLQQMPKPKGGGIIQSAWWQLWGKNEAALYGLEWQAGRREFPQFELVVASLDTAFKEKEENDFNALTVWGIWLDRARNRRAMLMYAWNKRLPLHGKVVSAFPGELPVMFKQRQQEAWGLVDLIADTCKRYKVKRLLIEDKSRGHDVANEIRRLYSRDNWGVQLINPVGDKVSRAHSIVPLFTDDAIWGPDTKWAQLVISQCESFPKAAHDDLVDSVTQFLQWARDMELLVRCDEQSAANEEAALYKHKEDTVAQQYGV